MTKAYLRSKNVYVCEKTCKHSPVVTKITVHGCSLHGTLRTIKVYAYFKAGLKDVYFTIHTVNLLIQLLLFNCYAPDLFSTSRMFLNMSIVIPIKILCDCFLIDLFLIGCGGLDLFVREKFNFV